ncbi:MAG: phosphoribosyltransferase [Thermoprotei archaeon]|nr:MAG: phosphoribosyltransferase [Thermoprotei archaeon]
MSYSEFLYAVRKYLEKLRSKVVFYDHLLELKYVFKDREDGGLTLAKLLIENNVHRGIDYILAIPRGGLPVAYTVSKKLSIKMDIVTVRKVLIPWNTEAGYGAVAPDGTVVINEPLKEHLGFSVKEVEEHVKTTLTEVRRREELFRRSKGYDIFKNMKVIVIDDGIASGYTMLVAVKFLKNIGTSKVYVGAPTASLSSIKLLYPYADMIYVPNIRSDFWGFAVAEAYIKWYDLTDEEVLSIIKKAKSEGLYV